MSVEQETKVEAPEGEEYVKPDPAMNPRNIALGEIAASVAEKHKVEFAETMPSIDDEGRISPPEGGEPAGAAPEAPPSAEPATPPSAEQPSLPAAPSTEPAGINPDQLYKVTVDGQEMEVPGRAIIDAGMRTFQKETAADYRLKLASQLLQEAEAKAKGAATPPGAPAPAAEPPAGLNDAQLAEALQFGTPEQAAAALKELRGRPSVSPEEIARIVDARSRNVAQDEIQFQEAKKFVQAEYSDLMSNDYLRRLFFLEENRRRAPKERGGEGDRRPYKELYAAIGNDLRKSFNLQKPAAAGSPSLGTAQARQQRKAEAPPVPRTAAARLQEGPGAAKVPTPSEIIASMAARRGSDRLFQPNKRS